MCTLEKSGFKERIVRKSENGGVRIQPEGLLTVANGFIFHTMRFFYNCRTKRSVVKQEYLTDTAIKVVKQVVVHILSLLNDDNNG